MRNLLALAFACILVVSSVLSVPAAAQTDVPLCGIMHTDKDGHLVCDDGPNGIMHTDSPEQEPSSGTTLIAAILEMLGSLGGEN